MMQCSSLMCRSWMLLALLVASIAITAPARAANILLNPGFETCTGACGDGALPDNWVVTGSSPDTWSNTASNGIDPAFLGDFTGVTAHSGDKWIGGWAAVPETFGQYLSSPLLAGAKYTLSGFLHQAIRPDLDVTGGYDVFLQNDATNSGADQVLVGHLGDTPNDAAWYSYATSFVAPLDAASLGFLLFVPTGGGAYPGLDDVSLSVAEPTTLAMLSVGLIALCFVFRRGPFAAIS